MSLSGTQFNPQHQSCSRGSRAAGATQGVGWRGQRADIARLEVVAPLRGSAAQGTGAIRLPRPCQGPKFRPCRGPPSPSPSGEPRVQALPGAPNSRPFRGAPSSGPAGGPQVQALPGSPKFRPCPGAQSRPCRGAPSPGPSGEPRVQALPGGPVQGPSGGPPVGGPRVQALLGGPMQPQEQQDPGRFLHTFCPSQPGIPGPCRGSGSRQHPLIWSKVTR